MQTPLETLQRVLVKAEFVGAQFMGWQLQEDVPTLQGHFEEKIKTVLHLNSRVVIHGCGRTDAGVHALVYYFHFDAPARLISSGLALEKFRHSLSSVLHDDVSVLRAWRVAPEFHAIKSALSKTYEYRVLLRRAKTTHLRSRVLALPETHDMWNWSALDDAIRMLTGSHNFYAFQASDPRTREDCVREIFEISYSQIPAHLFSHEGTLWSFKFRGRGFLKHMVRNMMGTLIEVAQNKRSLDTIEFALGRAGTRQDVGFCAPPEGLYLSAVDYAQAFDGL